MCRRLFLASPASLPLVGWSETDWGLQVSNVPDDRGIRERLGGGSLVEAATEEGCACDFDVASAQAMVAASPADSDDAAALDDALVRAGRLYQYVVEALSRGPVVGYVCWWDEEFLPPIGTLDVDADWFRRPALGDADRHLLRVV